MYLTDFHCHSICSMDGNVPVAEMAAAGKAAGLTEMCITDHCDLLNGAGERTLTYDWAPLLEQYERAKELEDDRFTLRLGLELGGAQVSPEAAKAVLAGAEPDFVIGSTKTEADLELLELLEQSGIPAAYFNVSSFADYLRMLDICTRLTGCPENYEAYGTNVQAQIDAAKARADGSGPSVLYVRATGSSCKVKNSRDTVLGEMLADLGCVNIADSESGLLENLSLETILAADPDYIFVVIQGTDTTKAERLLETTLLSNPAWDGLTAVREGRYHVMDQRLYNVKPNARWGEAYEKLADILYPKQ